MNRLILILLLIFPATCSFSQVLSDSIKSEIDKLVTRDVPEDAPGVAFGMVQNGKTVYVQYAGYADLDDSLKIGPTTRFNIASNGKQFTALAVLLLIQDGKLSLDDDIRTYFPELLPGIKEPIQIRHLLTHTSGIRDFYDLLSLQNVTWWKQTMDNQDVLEILEKQHDLNFPPGSAYLYSNSNYVLLAEIISQVSGQAFAEFTSQMFRRMGMNDTRFEPDNTNIEGPIARPYFNFNTWTGYDWVWNVVGDGNLFTTLRDLLHFEEIIQAGNSDFPGESVIYRSQKLIMKDIQYGYGLEFSEYSGRSMVFHHGATGAWKATFMRFPDISLITLSNSGKTIVTDQNQQIADLVLRRDAGSKDKYLIAPEQEGPYIDSLRLPGVYQDAGGTTFQFVQKPDGLYLVRLGRNDVKLERENNNVFHQLYDPDFKQEFLVSENGQLTVTAYYPTHPPYTLTRIDSDLSAFNPESIEGDYYNNETDINISVSLLENETYEISLGDRKTTGLLITRNKMLVDYYTFNFTDDSILLDGERIKQVQFDKSN